MLNSFSQKGSGKITGIHPEYLNSVLNQLIQIARHRTQLWEKLWIVPELGSFRLGLAPALWRSLYAMKWHICTLWMYSHFRDSGLKYSFQNRLLQKTCLPMPSSSQGTCINLHLQTHIYSNHSFMIPLPSAPWSLPPSTLPFQTVSSFFISADFHLT